MRVAGTRRTTRWVLAALLGSGLGGVSFATADQGSNLFEVAYPSRLSRVTDFEGPPSPMGPIPHHVRGWAASGHEPVRGMTLGPIESYLQPGRGYGSRRFVETLDEVARMGANWISLTVFSRVWDKKSVGIDLSFEQPYSVTSAAVARSVAQAHARGLRVLLVPHLWLESGEWRAEIDPQGEEGFARFAENYGKFVAHWAKIAESSSVDLFSVGVELRSWVTTSRAGSFVEVIRKTRDIYSGPLTYAANWDDAEDTVIWGELDVIGINAFYPLHWENGATYEQIVAGGYRVREEIEKLAENYERSVLFTEFGYTARVDTAVQPWLWPEQLGEVTPSEESQDRAYEALLGSLGGMSSFAGTFVWRMYADVSDLSQEPDWGFSPWGKPAGDQLRRLYRREALHAMFR